MPTVSPYTGHDVVMGFGTISIMGATPAALVGVSGNVPRWFSASKIVYQDYTSGAVLKTYDTGTLAVATVDASGANDLGGGGSVWTAWLAGSGLRSSAAFGPLAAAGLCQVSELGQTALILNRSISSGLGVYTALGVSQYSAAVSLTSQQVCLRQNILSYQDASGWHLVNVVTGNPVAGFQQRPNVIKLVPFTIGSSVGVLEYQTGTETLTVRLANSLTGLTIPTVGAEFNVDVQGVDADTVRVAWSLTAGEAPDDLVILDIDTDTGTTNEGTVVSGAVVFDTGPTLSGTTFAGSTAAAVRLPVQSVKAIYIDGPHKGEMTKPWRDVLQGGMNGVQSAQTSVANLPTPVPPDGFGSIGGVDAPGPNSTLTFTSLDGSVTITPDQPSSSVDFSVVGISFYMSPLTTGGDPTTAELIFGPDGDVVMVPVDF